MFVPSDPATDFALFIRFLPGTWLLPLRVFFPGRLDYFSVIRAGVH